MPKTKLNINRMGGRGLRLVGATALACSIAAFGCTTNHTPGDGQPSTMSPAAMPAETPGSSSGNSGNPPMASASSVAVSPDGAIDSAAIAAAGQRERFLGYINPSGQQEPQAPSQSAAQVVQPALTVANPGSPATASASPYPGPDLATGAAIGIDDAELFPGLPTDVATTANVDATGAAVLASIASGTATGAPTVGTGTPLVPPAGTTVATTSAASASASAVPSMASPTTAALASRPNMLAAGSGFGVATTSGTANAPTVSSSSNRSLTPTVASATAMSTTHTVNPPIGNLSTKSAAIKSTSASTTQKTTTIATKSATTSQRNRAVPPVRIVTDANGNVIIANVPTTTAPIANNKQ